MISSRRARIPQPDKRTITRFTEATLVSIEPNLVYFELAKSIDSTSLDCSFCSKTTMHEHELNARIKFDPKAQKYYLSFINKSNAQVQKQENKTKIDNNIFPLLIKTEEEASKLAKKDLIQFCQQGTESDQKIIAINVQSENELVIFKANLQPKREPNIHCAHCQMDSSQSCDDVVRHFRDDHGLAIRMKRFPSFEFDDAQDDLDENTVDDDSVFRESHGFTCELCGASFNSADDRTSHLNEVHAARNQTEFQCIVCLQKFTSRQAYHKHRKTFHNTGLNSDI